MVLLRASFSAVILAEKESITTFYDIPAPQDNFKAFMILRFTVLTRVQIELFILYKNINEAANFRIAEFHYTK